MLLLIYIKLMLSGVLHGLREKVHQTPRVFEELFPKLKDKPVSFLGREMDKMKYKAGTKEPKNFILSIFPYNDFWHSSHYLKQAILVLSVCLLCNADTSFLIFKGKVFEPFIVTMIIVTFWGGFSFWVTSNLQKRSKKKQLK